MFNIFLSAKRISPFSILLLTFLSATTAWAEPNCSNSYDGTSFYNFKTSCFKHDVCYSEAGLLGLSRAECDKRFYQDMKASCQSRTFLCDQAANVYYLAISNTGGDSFNDAKKKSDKIKALIQENKDKAMVSLLKLRANGQETWHKMNKICSKMDGKDQKDCRKKLSEISVPDYPSIYHLGGCNMLGINWKEGHRTANQKVMSKLTGLSMNQVRDTDGGDPCEGAYPDQQD